MLTSIWQDVQQQFRFGNRVNQIILVNVAVFIVVNLVALIGRGVAGSTFSEALIQFFSLSNDWLHNLTHPWALLTYAFLHEGLGHIFWNMLLFYWFGRIVGDLIGNERILPLYLWGAIAGGLLFWVTAALLPYGGAGTRYIVGASAGVMATIVAAAVIAPEYGFRLILLGEVRLKYIALAIILIDIFAFGTDGNTGGHFAHVGGMVMGYFFVAQLRAGNDLAEPINKVSERITSVFTVSDKKPKRRSGNATITSTRTDSAARSSRDADPENDSEERLDVILAKIKAKGIKSLSAEERDFLSLASRERP